MVYLFTIPLFPLPSPALVTEGKWRKRMLEKWGKFCMSVLQIGLAFNIPYVSDIQILAFHGVCVGFLLKTCGICTWQIWGDVLIYLRFAPRLTLCCLFLTPEVSAHLSSSLCVHWKSHIFPTRGRVVG